MSVRIITITAVSQVIVILVTAILGWKILVNVAIPLVLADWRLSTGVTAMLLLSVGSLVRLHKRSVSLSTTLSIALLPLTLLCLVFVMAVASALRAL